MTATDIPSPGPVKILVVPHPLPPSGRTGGDRVDRLIIESASGHYRIMEWSAYPDKRWHELTSCQKLSLPLRMLCMGLRLQRNLERAGYEASWLFNSSKCAYTSLLARTLRRKGLRAFSITHHPLFLQLSGLRRIFYKWTELRMVSDIGHAIAPSFFTSHLLKEELPGIEVDILEIPFPNQAWRAPSAAEKRFADKDSTSPDSPFRLLFIGSVEPRKGLHFLLEAMEILGNRGEKVSLRVIGHQPDRQYLSGLKTQAMNKGLDVRFEGYLPAAEKDAILSSAHALVLPSSAEGFGMVLVEAMAAGVPAVAFRSGGMAEVIGTDRLRGLLAHPGDPHSLAECIRSLIYEPSLRETIIRNGLEYAASRPSVDDFRRRLLAILNK